MAANESRCWGLLTTNCCQNRPQPLGHWAPPIQRTCCRALEQALSNQGLHASVPQTSCVQASQQPDSSKQSVNRSNSSSRSQQKYCCNCPNAAASSGSSNSSSRLSWQGQQQTSAAQHLSDKQVLSTAGDCESAAWRVGHSGCIDCSGNLGQCWYDAV